MKAKIIITDDHPLIRMGIKMTLMGASDKYEIIGEAGSAGDLFQLLSEGAKPDLILLDLIMPGLSGAEAARRLKKDYPDIDILILSSELSPQVILELVEMGVGGYISKNYTDVELTDAIDSVLTGLTYYGKDISIILRDIRSANLSVSDETFTERELEIIDLCRRGKRAKEIADELSISPRTVSNYKQNIFSKMGIRSNYEMIEYAIKHGIISSI